jgi:hypothetical protein
MYSSIRQKSILESQHEKIERKSILRFRKNLQVSLFKTTLSPWRAGK